MGNAGVGLTRCSQPKTPQISLIPLPSANSWVFFSYVTVFNYLTKYNFFYGTSASFIAQDSSGLRMSVVKKAVVCWTHADGGSCAISKARECRQRKDGLAVKESKCSPGEAGAVPAFATGLPM